jgi:NLP/P60 protein
MRPTVHDFVGKTWPELPCWELVVAWYAAQGIALRSYTDYWMGNGPTDAALSEWAPVREPQEGDILAMNLTGRAADHVGIYLGGGKFLHSTEYAGVCIEQLERYRRRIVGIYRYTGDKA